MRPANDSPSERSTKARTSDQTILVIDDDPFILSLMGKWLTAAGFRTIPAANGQEGLAHIRNQPFDLAVVDLALPEIDGLSVLSLIAGERPDLPVLISYDEGRLGNSIPALQLTTWNYISKPVNHTLLLHQLNSVLDRARLLKENALHRQHVQDEVARRTAELNRRSHELEQVNRNMRREISARKEIENKLQQAMEEWQTTFDAMTDFISIHDINYTIVKANKALGHFLGKSADDFIGKKCCEVFHGGSELWPTCPHRELLATGQPHATEIIDHHLGIPLLITVSPILSDGKLIGSIHVAKDLSRQKKLEEERQKNTNLESISVLCGGLAHDFNNLLAALGGYVDLAMMERKNEGLPSYWLNHAKMVTNLAIELTKQLLAFSKGGTPILNHVPVVMLIQDSLEHLRKTSDRIRYEMRIDDDIWPIMGDHGQLRIVLANIFYNAAEAMQEGGLLTLEAHNAPKGNRRDSSLFCQDSVQSSLEEGSVQSPLEGDAVLLRFTDQGVGISPEILDKIFDPYFTTSAKGATKGKGLGLSLCYSIVTKHHGQISVSSKRHQGTTVSIYLPAISAEA